MKTQFFRIPTALVALTLTLGIGAAMIAPAAAQDAPAAQANNHGGNRMGQLLMSLGLSDDQKTKIRTMREDLAKQNEGVTDPMQRRANMRAAFANIDKILTPEQDAKFKTEMAAMQARRSADTTSTK